MELDNGRKRQKASELLSYISRFIAEHGDVVVYSDWWCETCGEYHGGYGFIPELTHENKMLLKPK
jgi:hypothetical protein